MPNCATDLQPTVLDVSDTAALNQDATEDLKEIADRVTAAVDDPEGADDSVAFVDGPEKADRTVVKPDGSGDDELDPNESSGTEDDSEESLDVGLVESRDIQGGRVEFESEPDGMNADFDREDWEVYDYEKRLDKRFMSDKSGTSVYIGAPEEFAEWVGYSVEELPDGPAENGGLADQTDEPKGASTEDTPSGFTRRLLGE